MNTDFVLVRGGLGYGGVQQVAGPWYWTGRNTWSYHLEDAKLIATRDGAERIIGRRLCRGQWGNVGYMTVGEAREALAARRQQVQ